MNHAEEDSLWRAIGQCESTVESIDFEIAQMHRRVTTLWRIAIMASLLCVLFGIYALGEKLTGAGAVLLEAKATLVCT